MKRLLVAVVALVLAEKGAFAQDPPPDFDIISKAAIQKSLPLLLKGADTFSKKVKCVSCHNQSLPQMAFAAAREKGFPLDEKLARGQDKVVYASLSSLKPLLQACVTSKEAEAKVDFLVVDPSETVGYLLTGLAASKHQPDDVTKLLASYLTLKQEADGRFSVSTARPPSGSSEFMTTALAVNVLQQYGKDLPDAAARIEKARKWLMEAEAKNNEDKTFRLFGLKWSGGEQEAIQKAVADLLRDQHDDGGWGQLPGMSSDAYATGQALVALHEAGGLSTKHSAYGRGRFFLITTQKNDGSWYVKKRAVVVQTYVEAGYPGQGAQFISIAGASWATMALIHSVDGPLPASAAPAPMKPTAPKSKKTK